MKVILIVTLFILLVGFSSSCIDINSASVEELDEIVQIGEVRAKAIIDSRPFDSVDDLVKVYGIGEKTLEKIKVEGLACVDWGEVVVEEEIVEDEQEVVVEEVVEEIKEEKQEEIIVNSNSENIINLNPYQEDTDKIIYESKNEKIKNLGIYGFALFLVFVIVALLVMR